MGNASSADAGDVFLGITKNSARAAVTHLAKYKASLPAAPSSTSVTPKGGAFSPSKPCHQIPSRTPWQSTSTRSMSTGSTSTTSSAVMGGAYRLKIPPLFKDSGLISVRAVDTISRVENFIADHVLPK